MNAGDIYLAKFPFGDVPGMKLRPVLLLTDPIGPVPEVLVAYISSVVPTPSLTSDIMLNPADPEFAATGSKVISALRLHKLATIHRSSMARFLGNMAPHIQALVNEKLRVLLLES